MNTRLRSGARAAGAALVAALVALGGASSSHATNSPDPAVRVNLIEPGTLGSITLHKFENPPSATDLPHDGMEQPVAGLTPMPGVTFTVQQVDGYDLTTNAGWASLADLTPAIAQQGPFGAEKTVTTDGDGKAVAAGLPVGVYLVTETIYPAGATPVAPFLVTVPLTNPANDAEWVYDVHVYPKNAITTATKSVDDEPTALFDEVVWTILADIPDVEVIDGYKIVDRLDPRLEYLDASVSLTPGPVLVPGDDYLVPVYDDATHTVTVEFTGPGRAKLAASSAAEVQVDIVTRALEVGVIANDALVYPNLPSFTIEPGEPGGPVVTPKVETKWGNVTLLKFAKGSGVEVTLEGAEFAVYLTEADARNRVNPVATGSTGADGILTFTGLRYSAFADGKDVMEHESGYQAYWIAETKAPDNYELLAAPVKVVVDGTDTVVDYRIENVPSNGGFSLPLTGGTGVAVLKVAGVLLLAGAILLTLSKRRRGADAA